MSEVQRQEIEFWADLTIHIGRNHGAPAEQKERFYQGLMILTDPDHYSVCTVMRNLVACLRRELQRAHSEQKWALHTATPTTRTANQTWPSPWQLPANTQVINPSTHDTITVLSTGNNHSEIHNCTTSPATAKRKAPPPTLTNPRVPQNFVRPRIASTMHQLQARPRWTGGKCKTTNAGRMSVATYKRSDGPSQKAWRTWHPSEMPPQKTTTTPLPHQAHRTDQHQPKQKLHHRA